MKFCDLPIETQQRLNCERLNLHNRSINSAYEVLLYNQPGTRYFHARRHQNSWSDDKGNYMPFGGGSEWTLQYGCIGFSRKKQVMGTIMNYVVARPILSLQMGQLFQLP